MCTTILDCNKAIRLKSFSNYFPIIQQQTSRTSHTLTDTQQHQQLKTTDIICFILLR